MTPHVPPIRFAELTERHAAVLLDAYGVLVDGTGVLPRARGILDRLETTRTPYLVVTNDASRLPETIAARFASLGLPIPLERVLCSGMLLEDWVRAHALGGRRCAVLGTRDSHALIERAGAVPLTAAADTAFDALVIGDEAGYPFVEAVDDALSAVYAQIDAGRTPRLVVPNPDVVYPKRPGAWGFAAGGIAALLEAALEVRYGATAPKFERLGKPHRPIYARAAAILGTRDLVMVGDQLATDIKGAVDFGIASALVPTGVSHSALGEGVRPTYLFVDG